MSQATLKIEPAVATPIKLGSQLFGEILSALRNESASRNSEKRRTTRMAISARVLISPFDGTHFGTRHTTLAKDISIEGLGLLSAIAIKRGDSFVARLPRNETQTSFIICRVAFSGVVADGLFTLGSQFVGEIPPEMAHKFEDNSDSELQRVRTAMLS